MGEVGDKTPRTQLVSVPRGPGSGRYAGGVGDPGDGTAQGSAHFAWRREALVPEGHGVRQVPGGSWSEDHLRLPLGRCPGVCISEILTF